MKRQKIVAVVIDPCQCKHFKKGRRVIVDGPKPEGFCGSGYIELKRQAEGFLSGTNIPSVGSGKIITRCPHHDGAIWELSLEETA